MKTVITMMALTLVATLLAAGCSTMGLPQGSVLVGDYQGRFNSQFSWGAVKVRVYEAPNGTRPVFGQFDPEGGQVISIFRGEMKGSRLEAEFLEVEGTVTGELSADGKSMSGTFSFANVKLGPPGTWNVKKK
jgi:hypothetical protein